MSEKLRSNDVRIAMDKMIDTLKAYHGDDAYPYTMGTIQGMLLGCTWDMDQRSIKTLIDQMNQKTEETMHKLTLEKLRAKEPA